EATPMSATPPYKNDTNNDTANNTDATSPIIARCPGASTADIIRADGDHAPAHLTAESYQFLGDADIPFKRYTDPQFFQREVEQMWLKTWQWACREEELTETGDYVVY